jgi:hypothetical protein
VIKTIGTLNLRNIKIIDTLKSTDFNFTGNVGNHKQIRTRPKIPVYNQVNKGHELICKNIFCIPMDVLLASMTIEKRSIKSLIGSNASPGAKVIPTPMGSIEISVPCITDMTAFNALAEPKEIKALLSDESIFFYARLSKVFV